jgi:hypothetical protein
MISKEIGGIRALLKVLCHKKFSHPSFNYLLFSNPTHKIKTGTPNRWETNNNPPGPIKPSGQSTDEPNQWSCSTSAKTCQQSQLNINTVTKSSCPTHSLGKPLNYRN